MAPHIARRSVGVHSALPRRVTRAQIAESTGWPVRYAGKVGETPPPTAHELEVLRDLHARTARAHGQAA